jgi:hypothetical protein
MALAIFSAPPLQDGMNGKRIINNVMKKENLLNAIPLGLGGTEVQGIHDRLGKRAVVEARSG